MKKLYGKPYGNNLTLLKILLFSKKLYAIRPKRFSPTDLIKEIKFFFLLENFNIFLKLLKK
jgi:hypothetical protein